MAITRDDINLNNFLEKFTFTNEAGKINIDTALFLQIASLLKISEELGRIAVK